RRAARRSHRELGAARYAGSDRGNARKGAGRRLRRGDPVFQRRPQAARAGERGDGALHERGRAALRTYGRRNSSAESNGAGITPYFAAAVMKDCITRGSTSEAKIVWVCASTAASIPVNFAVISLASAAWALHQIWASRMTRTKRDTVSRFFAMYSAVLTHAVSRKFEPSP